MFRGDNSALRDNAARRTWVARYLAVELGDGLEMKPMDLMQLCKANHQVALDSSIDPRVRRNRAHKGRLILLVSMKSPTTMPRTRRASWRHGGIHGSPSLTSRVALLGPAPRLATATNARASQVRYRGGERESLGLGRRDKGYVCLFKCFCYF